MDSEEVLRLVTVKAEEVPVFLEERMGMGALVPASLEELDWRAFDADEAELAQRNFEGDEIQKRLLIDKVEECDLDEEEEMMEREFADAEELPEHDLDEMAKRDNLKLTKKELERDVDEAEELPERDVDEVDELPEQDADEAEESLEYDVDEAEGLPGQDIAEEIVEVGKRSEPKPQGLCTILWMDPPQEVYPCTQT